MRRNGRLRRAKWLRLTGGSCNHDAEARTKHQHAGKRSGGREDHRSADKGANGCADLYVAPIASDKHAGSGDSHPRGAPDRHTRSGDDCANRASAS